MRLSIPLKFFGCCLPAFALWCFLYRGFLWGPLLISEDTFAVYAVVKYFLAHLKMGVLAHWNPFLHWGMGHIFQIGEFNPQWLLTLVLNKLGLDFYHAFLWTVVAYFFSAAIGFLCLLRRLFSNDWLCCLGFVLFVFSGIGMTVFTQVTLVLIFTPAVWFYYFLVHFYQTRKPASVLLMNFCLMIIATTYIPFYFVTATLCLVVLMLVLYPRVVKEFVCALWDWMRRHFGFFCLCALGLGLAVVASVLNWLYLRTDFLALARPAMMTYELAKDSGIAIGEILRDQSLFSFFVQALRAEILVYAREIFSLSNIAFDNQRIFYVPVIAHAIFFVSFWVKADKRMVLWGFLTFVLFLLAATRLTPVYEWAFNHIPFFQLFRNVFFLSPFIISLYIIFALQLLETAWFSTARRHALAILWALIGIGVFAWWSQPGYTMAITILSVLGLLAVWGLRFGLAVPPNDRLLWVLLVLLAVAQPVYVLSLHAGRFKQMAESDGLKYGLHTPLRPPEFAFVRPEAASYEGLSPNDMYRMYNWYIIAMTDAERFITFQYGYPTKWSYMLAKVPPMAGFQEYVRHKFVLYDQMAPARRFEDALDFGRQFILGPRGRAVNGPGQGIEVKRFNANQLFLTTQFSAAQFLVYNDSYHPFWKATVNGKPVVVNRANYAFKGIMVPPGRADVRFEFQPLGTTMTVSLVMLYFYLYLAFGIWKFIGPHERH